MFEVGDKVRVRQSSIFYRTEALKGGLSLDKDYEIESINRGIDGALDFDEVYLKGFPNWFCEFVLEKV